jgi:NAD(P) transhydrogenase subunit alpha
VTLGLIAVVLATVNMVGGFVVTDRMLEMFKGRSASGTRPDPRAAKPGAGE